MGYFISTLFLAFFILPHGDLDQRILEKTNQIALHPSDYELYMERGELYLQHEEYRKAIGDFSNCLDHDFANTRIQLGMSESLFLLNSLDSALVFADKALSIEPNHFSALELKSSILSQMARYCEAAHTLESLLSLSNHPAPVLFLDVVDDLESCGEQGSYEKAISILQDGIRRIGPINILQKRLVSLYKHSGRYDEALLVQNSIIEHSDLKIRPYFERALIYIEMKSKARAQEDLVTALSLIDQLPASKQGIDSIINMKKEMTELLKEMQN